MVIPILFTIFTRNLTPWLRTHSFGLLSEMGKITLETYLLQVLVAPRALLEYP